MADKMMGSPALPKSKCSECSKESQVDNNLREVIKKMAYDLFTCMKCKIINPGMVYFCIRNHCYCSNCIASKCLKCDEVSEFSYGKELKNVKIKCDWPKCKATVALEEYITHKVYCNARPYKCPLQQCQITVLSTAELTKHWHCIVPALIPINRLGNIQYDKYDFYEFYWLLDRELYHVLIDFSKEKTDILIEEINVLPNNNTFYFTGYCTGYKKWDTPIKLCKIGGKYKLTQKKSLYKYDFEKIKIGKFF